MDIGLILEIVIILLLITVIILQFLGKKKSDLGTIIALLKRTTDEQRDSVSKQISSGATEQFARFGVIQESVQTTLQGNREEVNKRTRAINRSLRNSLAQFRARDIVFIDRKDNFMMILWHSFQAALIACGGLIGGFFGEQDGSIYVLIAFVVADYVTGVMNAIVKKQVSSSVGAKGIFKKMMIFILIAIMHLVDKYLLGNGTALRTALTFFYVSNEGISVLENASELGLPVPKAIKDILSQLKKKMVNESNKIETIISEEVAEDESEEAVFDEK